MFEEYTKFFYMDFDGQRRAEYFFERIVVLSSLIGLVIGYVYQQFSLTIISLAIGFCLSALISIPPWPMYRQCPLRWQKHDPTMLEEFMLSGDACVHDLPTPEQQPAPRSNLDQQASSNKSKKSKK